MAERFMELFERFIRQHRALTDERNRLVRAHRDLRSRPFDAAEHRAHRDKLHDFITRLRLHGASLRTVRFHQSARMTNCLEPPHARIHR